MAHCIIEFLKNRKHCNRIPDRFSAGSDFGKQTTSLLLLEPNAQMALPNFVYVQYQLLKKSIITPLK